jgi:predicted nucleic acid-binding protein
LIVYVESNVVLEIALGQEQATAAETILQRAEAGAIDLAFPAVAVTEPIAAITRSTRDRRR